jgi:ligand-binding SRPBCC domain-containing protein
MAKIKLTTFISAPIERIFDLSRSIDLHQLSTKRTEEKAVAGRTEGLINKGETVTWEATHFGIRQRLTTRIPDMRRPDFFVDQMLEGAFKSIYHEHHFASHDGGTIMTDDFQFEAPYGILGRLFEKIVLKRYLTRFLTERNAIIKKVAESEEWKAILP